MNMSESKTPEAAAVPSNKLVLVVTKRPGKKAKAEVAYPSNFASMVGGTFRMQVLAEDLFLGFSAEKGLAGPTVAFLMKKDGTVCGLGTNVVNALEKLDKADW